MKKIKFNKNLAVAIFILITSFGLVKKIDAATTINLGTADGYAVLGGSTITNTGATTINGDLGLFPGTSVTGFPPGLVNGSQQITTAAANQAKVDLLTAFSDALSRPVTSTIPTQLGNATIVGGVYNSAAGTFDITGTLTLDGQNNPDTVFIFKADSTLITAATSSVVLINGAQACNVFWTVGSSATLGATSTLKGTIMASSSITLTTAASIEGRALALGAAATLDTNVITKPTCSTAIIPATVNTGASHFGSGPAGSIFGSAPVIPWWALATTTETKTVYSTTTVIPKFPNTGFGPEGSLIWMSTVILSIILSILTSLFFLKKNKKTN